MRTPLLSLLAAMTLLAPGPAALAQIEQRCVLLIDRFEDLTGRPVVQVIYDQVIRIEQSLEFDIDTATPSDQSGLTFRLSSAPAGMTINPSTGQVLWDPSPLQVGVFSATVLVEDSQGLRSRDTFCVEVVDDAAAPLITPIGDSALTVGQTLQLQVEATDPNPDDTVSFSLDEAPAGMTINAQSGLIEWIASLDDLGPNDVVVRASDDRGQFDLEAFALNVVETNAPPVIEPIPDRGAQPGIDVAIQVTASDPDDNNLAFRLLDRPAGMQINTETGLISWVPVTQQLGAHPVTVEVNDPAGFIDQTSFQIVVDFNRPPVAIDDGGYRVERGDTLSVPAPGILGNDEDPNNDPLTAQLVSGPTRGSVTLNPDGSFDYTPDNPAGQIGFVPALEFLIPGRGPIAPPLIADVNDDGRTDVVSQISNGVAGQNVFIISSPDTGELIATSPPLDRGVINGSGKALADIDLDGYVEIISIGGENSLLVPSMTKVFAFEHDGTFKWESEQVAERYTLDGLTAVKGDGSVNGTLDGAEPTIADLDQDGTPEIIVGHGVIAAIGQQSGLAVTVFDNQGMKLFTSYARGADIQAGGSFMRAEVVDLDLDGDPEILVGSAAFSHDGELLWTVDGLKNDSRRATPLAVNLDDDPFPELIRAGTTDSEIVALNHDGSNFWDEPASTVFNFQTFEAELVIADVEDDGLVDILAVGNNGFSAGKLEVLNGADGSLKWDYPSDASGLNVGVVSPTVFDLNGDGNQEVLLFGYQPRTLWVLAGDTGQLIQEFDLELGNPSAFEAPIFADVDNDGASELLINGTFRFFGAMSAYWVFESPDDNWAPTRSIWNQWNYHVTNVNPDGTIPRFEQPHWLVSGLNQNRLNGRLPEERVEENDSFEYAASDGQLASNIARVDITVLPPNAPPRIVSTPRLLASPNFEYIYPVLAVDADPGETLIVSVANGPDGMVIDALNQVTWTPTTDDLGPHVVVLDVVDSLGTRSSQTFTIEVVPPVAVPDLSGRTEAEAVTDLNAVTLEASPILDSFSDTVPAGDVMTQDPSPNTTVAAGSSVSVEISRGQIPVAVPRVLGLNLDEAQADLAISGLATGSVVWVNDPLIPRDSILAQDPPPNALIAPNSAVDLTVSGGPRAVIVLDPPVITSGKSAAVSVEVRDVDGTPLDPQPTLSLSLASDPGSSFGTLPVLSGFSITTSPDTQGAFELGVSYSAPDPESISAEFAVLGPISDGIQGDLYSRFSRQQQQFGVLIEQLITAVDQGDSAAIAALDADLAALAEAIDLRRLRTMIAIAPDGGALPTPEQAAALGTGNQDSAYLDTSLELVALLEVMESVVLDSNTPDRVLSQLNQDLAAAAAALASLEPSVPGILRANGAITALTGTLAPRLLVADIQAVRQALVDQGLNSGQTTQRKAGRFSLPGIMIASQIRQNIITNFYVPYLGQAARMLGAVIAADLLQTYANFGAISGIITGASQSIHVFGIQPSVIEGLGFDPTLSPNNAVIMVGPALLNAVSNAASALSSARSIKDVNSAFDAINGILDAADGLNDAWNDANSIPMGVVRGCILDNNPACSQLVYPDGFTSVYKKEGGLSLPGPVLIITRNLVSGGSAVFVANFVPTTE